MNERIRELAKQTNTIGDWGEDITEGRYFVCDNLKNLEKFAELIVEKCAGIIESQDVDPSFKLRMSWAVKKHFGVK